MKLSYHGVCPHISIIVFALMVVVVTVRVCMALLCSYAEHIHNSVTTAAYDWGTLSPNLHLPLWLLLFYLQLEIRFISVAISLEQDHQVCYD